MSKNMEQLCPHCHRPATALESLKCDRCPRQQLRTGAQTEREVIIAQMPVPKRIASEQSNAVRVAMVSGDRFRAIAAVEHAFELARAESGKMTSQTTVQFAFSIRIANVLESIGCRTIGDVEHVTPEQLESLPNVSSKTIQGKHWGHPHYGTL